MRRREFLGAVGGLAVWPLMARAQQSIMPVVGFLRSTGADGFAHLVAAFRTGLNEGGYVEGRNVATEFHWADDSRDRLRALVGDLVSRNVAVLVGNHNSAL